MTRIPVWPGVAFTFGGAPNPNAVLLVTYDWREPAPTPEES